MPYAHPTVEHFAPLFVTLGAAAQAGRRTDDGDRGLVPGALEAVLRGPLAGFGRGCRFGAWLGIRPGWDHGVLVPRPRHDVTRPVVQRLTLPTSRIDGHPDASSGLWVRSRRRSAESSRTGSPLSQTARALAVLPAAY